MSHEVQMINDKIIHKVKDDLLKLFELNPREINDKNQSLFSRYILIRKQLSMVHIVKYEKIHLENRFLKMLCYPYLYQHYQCTNANINYQIIQSDIPIRSYINH